MQDPLAVRNGLMVIAHRAAETVAAIAGPRERAKAAGIPVVMNPGPGDGLEVGTEDWRIVPELAPAADEVGFATEICVDTTARQALSRRYDLVLVADAHTATRYAEA